MEELIIKEREFKEKITELINNCGLPAFIVKPTIKDIYQQVENLENQQYNQALEIQRQKEEENKKEKKEDKK